MYIESQGKGNLISTKLGIKSEGTRNSIYTIKDVNSVISIIELV